MSFKPRIQSDSVSSLMQQQREQQKEQQALLKPENQKPIEFKKPEEVKDKIRIIFDNSASMYNQKIKDARNGTIEFMRNCVFNETACAIHVMNPYNDIGNLTALTTNLPALSILVEKIYESGSTPLAETLRSALLAEPIASRFVVFSDGEPNSSYIKLKDNIIETAKELKIPIDTVLIGSSSDESAYELLKELADKTGGYFLVFDSSKVDFSKAFKYLAPKLRGQLSSSKVRLALQAGELK